jgi:hypothetical protein
VRPSRKLLRTGESFTFHAVVTDASGCATGTTTVGSLAPGSATSITVDPSGKVTIPADAHEGAVAIVASAAGKSARVMVDVTAPAHYDDLLAKSGLNAAGENDNAAIAEIATGSIGGGTDTSKAEEAARKRRLAFIVVVGVLVVALGIIAIVFSRKAKRAAALEAEAERQHAERVRLVQERNREKAAAHAAQVRAHQESVQARAARKLESEGQAAVARAPGNASGTMVCPACRREYPATSAFCPEDASRLVPLNGSEEAAPAGSICPACKRGFDPGVKVCPFDREELIPYAMHAAARAQSPQAVVPSKGKICPTCGGRFDGTATFCGKDGTALVLLN